MRSQHMPRLALFFLGPPRIELDGEPVSVRRSKALALLAYLAVAGGSTSHRRETLATLLWPERDATTGRAELRRALLWLRRALGEGWAEGRHPLEADRESVALDATADVWTDVAAFRTKLAEPRGHAHPPDESCSDCLKTDTAIPS